MSDRLELFVSSANGKPTRLVELFDPLTSERLRDRVDTDSRRSREAFRRAAEQRFGCALDWLEDELQRRADAADEDLEQEASDSEKPEKQSQATIMVGLADCAELFHNADGETFARFVNGDHYETSTLSNRRFRRWLAHSFFEATGKAPSSQAVADALGVLEGRATHQGEKRSLAVRCGGDGDRIYLDLCDDAWRCIEVDADGWRIVTESPVLFRRARAMHALPEPVRGGSLDELRDLLRVEAKHWPLVLGWLVAAMRPVGPYPLLAFHGEQGSAKSTTTAMLRSLVDPNGAPLRSEPKEPRDLAVAANNSWVLAFDNLSYVPPWLSDALCRMSTGGGFACRKLYADDEEAIFDAQRPICINGIEELTTRPDLLDRSLLVELPVISEAERMPATKLWEAFNEAAPRILGALLDAVSAAIRNLPTTTLDQLPRMADFALWATAAEAACGLEEGDLIGAYLHNRHQSNHIALEATPVGAALCRLADSQGEWEGTASELLSVLRDYSDEEARRQKAWPKNARAMGAAVKRLAPNLRKAGIAVDSSRSGGNGDKVWRIAAVSLFVEVKED